MLEDYDDTYFPEKAINAGKSSYVERNQIMIDKSDFCIVYYSEDHLPPMRKNSRRDLFAYQPKSEIKITYDYARKHEKTIINLLMAKKAINKYKIMPIIKKYA